MEDILLSVENLSTMVSKDINFTVKARKVICIFGLNGSGKSVLLKTICNILEKQQGSILYSIGKSKIGVVLQFPEHLIFKESALDEALLIMDNNKEQAENLLKEINAEESISPFNLSDGQKRLMFVFGYLENKELILLDEPFVSLDDKSKEKVALKILEAKNNGKAIIYTANREVDKKIADTIITLSN